MKLGDELLTYFIEFYSNIKSQNLATYLTKGRNELNPLIKLGGSLQNKYPQIECIFEYSLPPQERLDMMIISGLTPILAVEAKMLYTSTVFRGLNPNQKKRITSDITRLRKLYQDNDFDCVFLLFLVDYGKQPVGAEFKYYRQHNSTFKEKLDFDKRLTVIENYLMEFFTNIDSSIYLTNVVSKLGLISQAANFDDVEPIDINLFTFIIRIN